MNCSECGESMGKIGGPSYEKMYACHSCGTREVHDTSSASANVDHVEDGIWSKMWGKFSGKNK